MRLRDMKKPWRYPTGQESVNHMQSCLLHRLFTSSGVPLDDLIRSFPRDRENMCSTMPRCLGQIKNLSLRCCLSPFNGNP